MPLAAISDLGGPDFEALFSRARGLSAAYDTFVENEDGGRSSRAPGIHASELSCPRRVFYTMTSTEKKGKLRKFWRQRFTVGKYLHKMIQDDFENMARDSRGLMEFQPEVPIAPKYQGIAEELQLQSSCDGVFTFRDHPYGPAVMRMGLEIKTEAPDGYEKLTKPKEDHLRQAHLYMRALDLPLMYFFYMNKANHNNTTSDPPYLVVYDHNIWAGMEKECRERLSEVASGVLPAAKDGMHCEFCPYSWTCNPPFLAKRANAPQPQPMVRHFRRPT